MNIILFGCKDTTLHFAQHLSRLNVTIDLITISPSIAKKNNVAGYVDLRQHSNLFKSIYTTNTYKLDQCDFIRIKKSLILNIGFCIGWQRLIPAQILNCFNIGIFGMHGSARDLPFGKGRSPMNWAILERRALFHTNLFMYRPGVDNGPIVASSTFSINSDDTAETLHFKNTLAMCKLVQDNLDKLRSGTFPIMSQSLAAGQSFYPKRNPEDGLIDWKDDILNITALIRAVTKPFDGAFSILEKEKFIIYRANIFYTDLESHAFKLHDFGEVVDIFPNGKFLVRCSGGILIVHDYLGKTPLLGNIFENAESPFARFKRNDYGFFDQPSD